MQINHYKTGEAKFSLWGRRMAWNGLDANAAIEGAIADAQGTQVEKTVQEILEAAKTRLVKPADYDSNEDSKAAYDRALLAVLGANAKYEKASRELALRAKLNVRLGAVNPDGDILHAVDELEEIKKQQNNGLPEKLRLDLSEKVSAVKTKATEFYNGKKDVVWYADEAGVKADYPLSQANFRSMMADISEMQQLMAADFKGYVEGEADLKSEYDKRIEAGMKWLQDNRNATETSDVEGEESLPVATDDEKSALDRLDFAVKNLSAAERSGEKGHEAGARQYMAMVLAEQEARRVWAGLSEKGNGIGEQLDSGSDEALGQYATDYNLAVQAFNDGLALTGRSNEPKYDQAARKFKEAAAGFRKLQAEIASRKEQEDQEAIEKIKKEFKAIQDKIAAFYVKRPYLKSFVEKEKGAEGKQAVVSLEAGLFDEAKEKIQSVLDYCVQIEKDYIEAHNFMIDASAAAANHCDGLENFSLEAFKKVFSDYLGNNGHLKKKELLSLGSVSQIIRVQGKAWGVAEVSFNETGVPSVNLQYRPAAEVKEVYREKTKNLDSAGLQREIGTQMVASAGQEDKKLNEWAASLSNTEIETIVADKGYERKLEEGKYLYVSWVNGRFWVRMRNSPIPGWEGKKLV
jgi:hypothetical protein